MDKELLQRAIHWLRFARNWLEWDDPLDIESVDAVLRDADEVLGNGQGQASDVAERSAGTAT